MVAVINARPIQIQERQRPDRTGQLISAALPFLQMFLQNKFSQDRQATSFDNQQALLEEERLKQEQSLQSQNQQRAQHAQMMQGPQEGALQPSGMGPGKPTTDYNTKRDMMMQAASANPNIDNAVIEQLQGVFPKRETTYKAQSPGGKDFIDQRQIEGYEGVKPGVSDGTPDKYERMAGIKFETEKPTYDQILSVKREFESQTGEQRKDEINIGYVPELQADIAEDPNIVAEEGKYRQNADGGLFLKRNGAPQELLPINKMKRGVMKPIKVTGGLYRDAVEIQDMLRQPDVQAAIGSIKSGGFWDSAEGKLKSGWRKFLLKQGVADNSDAYKTLSMLSKFAATTRHDKFGSALTKYEIGYAKPWVTDPGDTMETTLMKINMAAEQGEQDLREYIDLYQDAYNTSSIYRAFGLKRFGEQGRSGGSMVDDIINEVMNSGS